MQECSKACPTWTDSVVIGRHAFGDQYRATDFKVPGKGKLKVSWVSDDGKNRIEHDVYDFPGPGVALSMYNLDQSIIDFASMHEFRSNEKMASLYVN